MAQASLCGKIKCELDVKISDEEFYNIYSRRMYEMAKISPKIIRSAELLKGQWGEEGSIIYWNYNLDGKHSTAKEETEVIDDKTKTIIYKVIEGELLEYYRAIKCIVQVTPKEDKNGCLVNCSFEYEKMNENIPDPDALLHAFTRIAKDVEAYLAKA
ncbi:kirola-like [Carica papaya]|uniref:kirola-like n=1 Tax=Carica papaya TaxID=3649 RepID=UPI000B8CC54E|nr:kirola-like [Carica papaya]